MVMMWTHLSTMPHSAALFLNRVTTSLPSGASVCKAEAISTTTGLGTITTASSRHHVRVRNSSNSSVRTSSNPRSQSSVIDAQPVATTDASWFLESLQAEELPGWQKVKGAAAAAAAAAAEGEPVVETPSKEARNRNKFGDNVQESVDVAMQVLEQGALERSSNSASSSSSSSSSCEDGDGDDDEAASSTTSRSSRHGNDMKQRGFYSRPDMIRWRLVVEGVQTPMQDSSNPSSPRICRTSQHLQDVILFLESLGLDSSTMLVRHPLLSTCTVENIRAVVRFLETNKLRRRDVVKILNNNPFLLSHSVETSFLPVIKFLLTEVGLREKDVTKVVIRCARLLTSSVDHQLRPTMRFLQSLGFNHMPIVVSNNATLLASSIENRLIPKLEFLIALGLSKDEAVQALIRFPAIFNYSIEKNLHPKFLYLVDDMGRGLEDLRSFPQFFGYSLEYRIRPRYLFLKKRNLSLPLGDLLKPTDEVFYARFQHEKLIMREEKERRCVT